MNNVFLLLSFLAVFKLLVEEGERHSWWLRGVHALLLGSFVVALHPICLTINKIWVDETLNTLRWLNDVTLYVMLDLLLCILAVTSQEVRWPSRARYRYYGLLQLIFDVLHKLAYYLPPLLIFPALFYFRVELLYLLTGYSFTLVTALLAIAVVTVTLFAPYLSRFLAFNRETAILLSFLTFLLVVTAMLFTPEGLVHGVVRGSLSAEALHAGLLLLALTFVASIGFLVERSRRKRLSQ